MNIDVLPASSSGGILSLTKPNGVDGNDNDGELVKISFLMSNVAWLNVVKEGREKLLKFCCSCKFPVSNYQKLQTVKTNSLIGSWTRYKLFNLNFSCDKLQRTVTFLFLLSPKGGVP